MKIEKTEKPKTIKKSIKISESLVVDIVKEGVEYRVEKLGVAVSRVSGDFETACFIVDDYKLCFNRDELEAMLQGEKR